MSGLYLFTHINSGGIGQFNRRLMKELDKSGIRYEFKVRPTLSEVREAAKNDQVIFLINNVRIYFYLLLLPAFSPSLILHDYKARFGASWMERLILFLFDHFRYRFKRVIIHNFSETFRNKANIRVLPLPPHGPESGRPALTLLFFGRIEPYKNILFIAALAPHCRDVRFLIVGAGKISKTLHRKLRGCPNITLINTFVDGFFADLLFSACDYVILPYIDVTQTGLIGLATSHSKPVLISNIEGFNWVKHEEFVKVLDIGSVDAAARVVNALPRRGSPELVTMENAAQKFYLIQEAKWEAYVHALVE